MWTIFNLLPANTNSNFNSVAVAMSVIPLVLQPAIVVLVASELIYLGPSASMGSLSVSA